MWDFSTDSEFQEKLDWMDKFVTDEVEPLDHLTGQDEHLMYRPVEGAIADIVRPLQAKVKEHGLWACHLGPELGGQGYGQVKLALINEILGRTAWGPIVFGCQAPDTGNAEILAMFGTDEQKQRYLQPLLAGELFSAFSMTEPQGGADPRMFRTKAVQDGEDWIINGEKYFTSNARNAAFLIIMAVTEPDASPRESMSMFLVPTETPGIERVRDTGMIGDPPGVGIHPHMRYTDVRVGPDALLGERGKGFFIAQARLAGGRLHHAMRTVGLIKRAFGMQCERALSRNTFHGVLADNRSSRRASPTRGSRSNNSGCWCCTLRGRSIRMDIARQWNTYRPARSRWPAWRMTSSNDHCICTARWVLPTRRRSRGYGRWCRPSLLWTGPRRCTRT